MRVTTGTEELRRKGPPLGGSPRTQSATRVNAEQALMSMTPTRRYWGKVASDWEPQSVWRRMKARSSPLRVWVAACVHEERSSNTGSSVGDMHVPTGNPQGQLGHAGWLRGS